MTSGRTFEAPELIEVMDEAVNYSRFLIEALLTWSDGFHDVLDFGAGNGRFAAALHERGRRVHAVEPDPNLRGQIEAEGVRGYEDLASVQGQPLDGVYSINVLEHLEDDRGFLSEFYRCLGPGGGLFLYVPAFPVLFSSNDTRVGHVRRYTRSDLVDRVTEAGFVVQDARYVDCLGFFAGLIYRFFGNPDGDLGIGAVKLYDRGVFPVSRVIDRIAWPVLGKNLLVRAVKPREREALRFA